jgi:2-dehydro-3-deoxyphosphogluconate aldolase/(4S)-4-hydroxy-2-oxoglutarate aldolase
MTDVLAGLKDTRLLAIIRGTSTEAAIAAGVTLIDEGVRFIEVSLTTPGGLAVIEALVASSEGRAAIGAGTVLTRADVDSSVEAGATFLLSPAIAESLPYAVSRGVPIIPGVYTPSEVVTAMGQGAMAVKLFPAATGGPDYLKALRDPVPAVPFLPVGGVDADVAEEYLARGAVAVGVGSPLVGDAASGGDLDALRMRAREFLRRLTP